MTLVEASELLRLSYRQTKRAWSRYQSEGDADLVHRLRGRPPNRHSPEEVKQQSLALYRQQYADYGPTLAAECLEKEDGVKVSVTTLRRWLLQEGLLERRRKRRQHRRRRTRREHLGELVQMDGSHHDWFEGRRGWAVLMVMIDDATGRVTARFYENESWASSSDLFQRYAKRHGLPRGLYVDQHSIYRPDGEPTDAELLDNCPPETQFGRAMRELDVELILARSPQAKGRVERMNGTLQDRLVKALRRAKISDLEAANRFLDDGFLAEFNARFEVVAVGVEDWHRPLAAATDLSRIVSIQEVRVVAKDWTPIRAVQALACRTLYNSPAAVPNHYWRRNRFPPVPFAGHTPPCRCAKRHVLQAAWPTRSRCHRRKRFQHISASFLAAATLAIFAPERLRMRL
jgi:transposase